MCPGFHGVMAHQRLQPNQGATIHPDQLEAIARAEPLFSGFPHRPTHIPQDPAAPWPGRSAGTVLRTNTPLSVTPLGSGLDAG